MSLVFSAFVATFVGFAASVAVVLAAAETLGATPAQTVSWIAGLALAKGAASLCLSWRHRLPIICAWSTPGAALIAASSGLDMAAAVGAFLLAAVLMMLTAAFRPLGALIEKIPMPIAAAMLAGVIFRFVVAVFDEARVSPGLVLPLLAVFLLARLVNPFLGVIAALGAGILLSFTGGLATWPAGGLSLSGLEFVTPRFDTAAMLGIGIPLYLVTMAAQNLPGFAVLRAAGYQPPVPACLFVTGLTSFLTAPFGAHMVNMAAISASICTGPDTHRDPAQRWKAGIVYGLLWLAIAATAGLLLALILAMPKALIVAVAGLGLVGSLTGALTQATASDGHRFAAVVAFAVAASSLTLFGVGSAFWSLVAGLGVLTLDAIAGRLRARS
ncbi:MAG TPA: benzoate/H(+) symporter BenE family transporter [Bosea sp. (in: a-proteobacteria)]|jgi:benzoate membrane transport protein|uniref:benzoate/H(+) symporter BenE family transporter n=1 Tax=Bosea sp. (in: a-proteobacteria) TaxID=1871050 RepID=UPI002DDCF624|nr:benzoate/H(+) symporter BenE family transporter [Bosea sp. (in: a-proteobacteria)]HEV2552447.1 benzoate/H(+) symporter BenE family transporter [Bosea sp. (in: a-proteobacteria)]